MRRKSVRLLLKGIGELRTTLKAQRARIGRRLATRLAAPPGVGPAYGPVLQHLEAELVALETDLAAAEDRYALVKQRPCELRRKRDAVVAELHQILRPLKRLLATISDAWKYAGTGSTPASPLELAADASSTVDFLRQLERDPPPPVLGVSLDPGAAAADLEAARLRLESVLEVLPAAESDAVAAREKAAAAMEHAKNVAPWVAQAIEGLAGLAQVESVGGLLAKRGS